MTNRAYIPYPERLASALADKLPAAVRDDLRAKKVPAETVIAMFTPDHIVLHTWGGPDRWFNIDMRLRGPELKAKDAADTSRAAKARRIRQREAAHAAAMEPIFPGPMGIIEAAPVRRTRPKSKIPSRPFDKRHRPMRGGNGFKRRQT